MLCRPGEASGPVTRPQLLAKIARQAASSASAATMGQCTSASTKSEKYRPLGEVFRAKVLPVHGDVELPGALDMIGTRRPVYVAPCVSWLLHWLRGILKPLSPKAGAGINVGLCASGGGCRAMSFSTGVYRALNELEVLGKLDAISSVSGGTWCSSILMFAREP